MKSKLAICILSLFLLAGCAGIEKQPELTEFVIESIAMEAGYESRGDFEWTDKVELYYNAIQSGIITIDGAQAAEKYLRGKMHPVIADRMVKIAGMVGFELDDVGSIVGVDKVEIPYLQAAARGFKLGLELDE